MLKFKTIYLLILVFGIFFGQTHASAASRVGICEAHFKDDKTVTIKDSSTAQNIRSAKISTLNWDQAIEKIKTADYFDFDTQLFLQMVEEAALLTPEQRHLVLLKLADGYHQIQIKENRRKIEMLMVQVGRFDLLFEQKIKQGLSPIEAYYSVHETLRQLSGGAKAFEVSFLIETAEAIRQNLVNNEVVFLYGSSVTGRSVLGKSDVDARYVHPSGTEQEKYSTEAFEKNLVQTIQRQAQLHYQLDSIDVQTFDITPDQYHTADSWKDLGHPGPFVIRIQNNSIDLIVFSPYEFQLETPPESRPWQISYRTVPTKFSVYRLK